MYFLARALIMLSTLSGVGTPYQPSVEYYRSLSQSRSFHNLYKDKRKLAPHFCFVIWRDKELPCIINASMLQEEQIVKLTKLKELLDAGILSEEEFAKEKEKVLANPEQTPPSPPKQPDPTVPSKESRKPSLSATDEIGPANVGLSSGIVLPLGILAIISSLISAIFTGLDDYSMSLDPDYDYFDNTYSNISEICTIISLAAELILWICAFNKLSTMSEGKRLGRIPLWTYLFLGAALLLSIVSIADPLATESPVIYILSLAALAFGFVAYISLYKAYSGKMRTYSIVWMIGMAVSLIMALVGADLISTIIETGLYVFLMFALLEKEEA